MEAVQQPLCHSGGFRLKFKASPFPWSGEVDSPSWDWWGGATELPWDRACVRPPGTVPGTAEVLLQGVGCKPRHLPQSPAPPWVGGSLPFLSRSPPTPRPQQNRGPSQSDCGGLRLAGGPLRPSPGASLHLPASFHARSGGVTCETLTFTSFTQSRGGLGPLSMTGRCQLALRGAPRGSAGSLRPRPLGLISHACHERSGCVSAFVVRVCFPLQP